MSYHKYRSVKAALDKLGRYMNMHARRIVLFRSRYIVVGISDGEYHVLGDHGWAYDLPDAVATDIVAAYLKSRDIGGRLR